MTRAPSRKVLPLYMLESCSLALRMQTQFF